jgi:hypothetical protein
VLSVTLLMALAGCVTEQTAFQKPGVSPVDRRQDESACLREAVGADLDQQLLAPYRIDREVFIRWMEKRGYTATPR